MRAARLVSSLTNRIFVGTALLVVIAIAASVYRVNLTVSGQAEVELQRELAGAGQVVEEYQRSLFGHFLREARLLADLPRLKAAVATRDPATVQGPVDEFREQIDSDILLVTGPDGMPLAASGPGVTIDADARAAMARASDGLVHAWLWPQPRGVLQMASLPIWIDPGHPELLGTLSVGFSLDHQRASRFRALTGNEIAFAHQGRVLVSTAKGANGAIEAALRDGRHSVELAGEQYLLLQRPLSSGSTASGAGQDPLVVVLRSRADLERLLGRVHADLAVTALLAVLAATVLAYFVARSVTRPLRALTATMRDMARTGDLTHRPPPPGRWDDEDARLLSVTFATMTSSIAQFQEEAAQRERLSSLGRLSTVIAHEVRNPLMIIKGALHALRDSTDQTSVRAVAADIEDEVARLNRIVADVLDFARPISFSVTEAQANDVCLDAARAVSAPGRARIATHLDPSLPRIVTDVERLRQTLVNVLTNAQDASTADAPVTLSTTRGASGIVIEVGDAGPGIAADALPRIFEPYFTTRRTGTGIGLAVARNIVEGLGGTIAAAAAREGRGTTIRIELPASSDATGKGPDT